MKASHPIGHGGSTRTTAAPTVAITLLFICVLCPSKPASAYGAFASYFERIAKAEVIRRIPGGGGQVTYLSNVDFQYRARWAIS